MNQKKSTNPVQKAAQRNLHRLAASVCDDKTLTEARKAGVCEFIDRVIETGRPWDYKESWDFLVDFAERIRSINSLSRSSTLRRLLKAAHEQGVCEPVEFIRLVLAHIKSGDRHDAFRGSQN